MTSSSTFSSSARRPLRRRALLPGAVVAVVVGALLAGRPCRAAPRNLFEWSAVAPIVVTGPIVGEDGRYRELRVERAFRGAVEPETLLRIDLREANRSRNVSAGVKALRLDVGQSYVVLLQKERGRGKRKAKTAFRLVRGVRGARQLPAEGVDAFLSALERFVEIQDLKSESQTWLQFSHMLDETNPILLETALEQFLKFQRGDPSHLASLRPLLEHPTPDLRVRAVRLIAEILRRSSAGSVPDAEGLFAELVGTARRDDSVSVRVAATEALRRFEDFPLRPILEEIAAEDADQEVRYTAEKLLHDLD